MIEVQIRDPLRSNEGASFSSAHDTAFEAFVLERFGGVSQLTGAVLGSWTEAGVTYRDRTRVYVIAMASITQGGLLLEVVEFAKAHYDQLAIYVRYLGIAEVL